MMRSNALSYPKPEKKKKAKKHKSSIITQEPGQCFLCVAIDCDYRYKPTEEHHIFGGPNRKLSEALGLKVRLCPFHHRIGPAAVHNNREMMDRLHRIGQMKFEESGSREDFIRLFGKNYLD